MASIHGARSGRNPQEMRPVEDADLQVGRDADLAGEPGIRLEVGLAGQALLFGFAHRRGVAGEDLDAAGRAPRVAAATVEDVNPGIHDRQDQFLPRVDLEGLLPLNRHSGHESNAPGSRMARIIGSVAGFALGLADDFPRYGKFSVQTSECLSPLRVGSRTLSLTTRSVMASSWPQPATSGRPGRRSGRRGTCSPA